MLTASRIASVTKQLLRSLGVNVSVWGPHSTRGAGVTMYKSLGLSSEEVCEIGQWKNTHAFALHYLHLGARKVVSSKISSLVHKISPSRSAEPDWSRTPRNFHESGERDQEGEAQSHGEPTLPSKDEKPRKRKFSPSAASVPLKFTFASPRVRQPPSPPSSKEHPRFAF